MDEKRGEAFDEMIAAMKVGRLPAALASELKERLINSRDRFRNGTLARGDQMLSWIEDVEDRTTRHRQRIAEIDRRIQNLPELEVARIRAELEEVRVEVEDLPRATGHLRSRLSDIAFTSLGMMGLINEAISCLEEGDQIGAAHRIEQFMGTAETEHSPD